MADMATYLAIIPFHADGDEHAKRAVMAYAEGLGTLRGEVDFFRATVQPTDGRDPIPLYCGEPGDEDGDFCVGPAGHRGAHHCYVRQWSTAGAGA